MGGADDVQDIAGAYTARPNRALAIIVVAMSIAVVGLSGVVWRLYDAANEHRFLSIERRVTALRDWRDCAENRNARGLSTHCPIAGG